MVLGGIADPCAVPLHPLQRRFLAEELVSLRRHDERQRAVASQRRGRIDPNPHQIDAVMFALRRLPEGGCILADEVGLGKTIEAGLVVAQRLAEGAQRVLLIVPKALMGQWQNELFDLFGVQTKDAKLSAAAGELASAGVFIAGREWAGSENGAAALEAAGPCDLCVIDEAHEVFAGVHKRFNKYGEYLPGAKEAQTAHRVRQYVRGNMPVLLLTATPIQNSLAELWGLVQYVEPTNTLLGNLATFREVFCDKKDDRLLHPDQAGELKDRIAQVIKRTLRRDAQKFLEKPFVPRKTRLFEYSMTEDERALYDDVTGYLLEPTLCAFPGRSRRLLLIGFHRRMASSLKALAASLANVEARLEKALEKAKAGEAMAEALRAADADLGDLELDADELLGNDDAENLLTEDDEPDDEWVPTSEHVAAELERVRGYRKRAEKLPHDSKAEQLLRALELLDELPGASGKLVIFTESLTTQRYLRDLLVDNGNLKEAEITLFSGTNSSDRAREALEAWDQEIGNKQPKASRPSRQVAQRLALVHEFRTRSRVFISTEAGAKGLNLQFCEVVVNYDLPWNPQRIEQRIGRCHRYGQERHVLVINFINRDNEAQRLVFDILSRKLDLFGDVLDASDEVLHSAKVESPERLASAMGLAFDADVRRIYERARSKEELEAGVRELDQTMEARRSQVEQEYERTAGLIESQLHEEVQRHFRQLKSEVPERLKELDQALLRTLTAYLDAIGARYDQTARYVDVRAHSQLPEGYREGVRLILGGASRNDTAEPLHVGHPLMTAALREAAKAASAETAVAFDVTGASEGLASRAGAEGRFIVEKVSYHRGLERVERLLPLGITADGDFLLNDEARALLELPMESLNEVASSVDDELVEDAFDEALFDDDAGLEAHAQKRFEMTMSQLERFVEDRALVQRKRQADLRAKAQRAEAARDSAAGPTQRDAATKKLIQLEEELSDVEAELDRLNRRDDEEYARWKQRAQDRRYAAPQRERIIDVSFVLRG